VLETPGSARAFRDGFQTGVIAGGKALIVDTAKLIGKGAQLAGDTSHAGYAGDALRGFTGKLPEALEAVVPSHNRSVATIKGLGEGFGTTAVAIAKYTTTHTPADLLADTKAFVAKNWDSLKASHSDAAARGPQAEAKWWGEVSGRAVFEAAATFVPVAGIASKLGKGAQIADKATDITRTAERALAHTGDNAGRVARVEKQAAAGVGAGAEGARGVEILIAQTSKRTGIPEAKIKEILDTPKGQRPDPTSYMSEAQIKAHLEKFEDGVVRIGPSAPTGTLGRTETWVLPKKIADEAVGKSKGDPRELERLLGFDRGYLGNAPVRVDIPLPSNVRIPSGNEFGANGFWKPGGLTSPGLLPEAVIDPASSTAYSTKSLFIGSIKK
jgi:hypothetical protein